jgi:hypothetical protein
MAAALKKLFGKNPLSSTPPKQVVNSIQAINNPILIERAIKESAQKMKELQAQLEYLEEQKRIAQNTYTYTGNPRNKRKQNEVNAQAKNVEGEIEELEYKLHKLERRRTSSDPKAVNNAMPVPSLANIVAGKGGRRTRRRSTRKSKATRRHKAKRS